MASWLQGLQVQIHGSAPTTTRLLHSAAKAEGLMLILPTGTQRLNLLLLKWLLFSLVSKLCCFPAASLQVQQPPGHIQLQQLLPASNWGLLQVGHALNQAASLLAVCNGYQLTATMHEALCTPREHTCPVTSCTGLPSCSMPVRISGPLVSSMVAHMMRVFCIAWRRLFSDACRHDIQGSVSLSSTAKEGKPVCCLCAWCTQVHGGQYYNHETLVFYPGLAGPGALHAPGGNRGCRG